MKAVTIHLDEPVYQEFQKIARRSKRSTSELIREAMDHYRKLLTKKRTPIWQSAAPASVGSILEPWTGREDMMGNFLDRE